jgi:MFS transporter, MHS family, shikimate and dehydroshikimate transport protein
MEEIMAELTSPSSVRSVSPGRREARRVGLASVVGTSIEWYDFFVYSQAAALSFGTLFFPELSHTAGILAGFATFGVGFAARPVGAVIFGHFGDRIGRKATLVTTLLTMGVGTFLVGCLPTYGKIGVWAPLLLVLLRLLQGLAVGGEWGGAVLMSVEHSPKHRRGFYGSWPQMGIPIGLSTAALLLYILSVTLDKRSLDGWGWRIPFLVSALLVIVGLIVRLRVAESPLFKKLQEQGRELRIPIAEVIRTAWSRCLLIIFAQSAVNVGFYVFSVYSLSYATNNVGETSSDTLIALVVAAAFDLIAIPLWGHVSDRVGRRPVLYFGSIFLALYMYPFFVMVRTGSPVWLAVALAIGLTFGHASAYSAFASFAAEKFDSRTRYTGASVVYQLSSALISGPAPFIATALVAAFHSYVPVVLLVVLGAVIAVCCITALSETKGKELEP